MNRLRNRLIAVFIAATLIPMALTLWAAHSLLERSLRYSSTLELDQLSTSLERTARLYYQRERERLRADVDRNSLAPERFPELERRLWPTHVERFWMSAEPEMFTVSEGPGDVLYLLVRREGAVLQYARPLGGVQMESIRQQYARARQLVEDAQARDLRGGFFYALLVLAAVPWLAALAILIYSAHRISAVAMAAYNRMAAELQESRERLLYLTRMESWQSLARKAAHEVKNSLTPIRLMMEELAARHSPPSGGDGAAASFERQAANVIVQEVNSLERRVRAFSEFAAEPPVRMKPVDTSHLVEERVSFLKAAHPAVRYEIRAAAHASTRVMADEDLLKAVLTNLIENAAHAAGPGGQVLLVAGEPAGSGQVAIEIHDSGPGLSEQALASVFEPTISFKKGGMGLGLSIARKSAVLCGGDIVVVKGELGGAGFRVLLSPAQ